MNTSQQSESQGEEGDTDGTAVDDTSSSRIGSDSEVDPAAVRAAIHTHGERIKQQELQQALRKLDANGDLTDAQRRVVDEMATAILDDLLSTPDAVLAAADDSETLRTVIELFDPTG